MIRQDRIGQGKARWDTTGHGVTRKKHYGIKESLVLFSSRYYRFIIIAHESREWEAKSLGWDGMVQDGIRLIWHL